MNVEPINYISDFNPAWPLGTDIRRFGDDHLRGIKTGILGTFSAFVASTDPNFEVMTRSQAELNSVIDRILRSGDTMTGPLKGHQVDPTADLDYVTKKWVENLYDGVNPGGGSDFDFGITGLYTSPETVIQADTHYTFTHGLGDIPSDIVLRLRCITPDDNYLVDDVILVNGSQSNDTLNNFDTGGTQIGANATELFFTVGTKIFTINKDTGGFTSIVLSRWLATIIGYTVG